MKEVLYLIFLMQICLVSSAHLISISNENYSKINENTLYNITINNTDKGQTANITQINITLPESFIFKTGSQGTNAISADFMRIGSLLTWANFEEYIVNGSESRYFWFQANASAIGNYNISVTTINATGNYNSKIQIRIEACSPNWTCSSWSSCINHTQTRNCADASKCNNEANKPAESQSCDTECSPSWNCTGWSECIGGTRIRTCVDSNLCGGYLIKPEENQSCETECIPDWICDEWSECINSTRSLICIDSNNCGTEKEKPTETKICQADSDFSWLFIVMIILVVILIIVNIVLIKKELKKQSKDYSN